MCSPERWGHWEREDGHTRGFILIYSSNAGKLRASPLPEQVYIEGPNPWGGEYAVKCWVTAGRTSLSVLRICRGYEPPNAA